jgi:hypothetical protein
MYHILKRAKEKEKDNAETQGTQRIAEKEQRRIKRLNLLQAAETAQKQRKNHSSLGYVGSNFGSEYLVLDFTNYL